MGDNLRLEKLRIALATPEFITEHDFDGGLANLLARTSKLLANLGHDVHVVTLSQQDDAEFDHDGVMVHRVTLKRGWHGLSRLTRYKLPTTLYWLNFSAEVFRKLKQLHRKEPFHLIQYPNYSYCGLFSIPLLRTTHVVRVSSYDPALHDLAGMKRNLDLKVVELLQSLQYRFARNVHVPSLTTQTMLSTKAGLRNTRLIRNPFYIDTRDWDTSVCDSLLKDKKYILYFGRFQLHKGFDILVQALPRFFEQYPDAYAVLAGRDRETQLASSMAAFARAHCRRFEGRLILLDNLRHAQLYPMIERSHLVVLPSLIENWSNSCMEAMGLGKVVIGTRGTSFEELITDGVSGFLVDSKKPDALADKLIAAWVDPKLNQMAAAAKQRINDFAPEKTVGPLLSYYAELLNGRAARDA